MAREGSPCCDIPPTRSSVPALLLYFHGKLSQDVLSAIAQGKSLHYGPGAVGLAAESRPGARCHEVPELVNCNVLDAVPFAVALFVPL